MRLGAMEVVAAEGAAQLGALRDDGTWDLSVIQHLDGPFSSRRVLQLLREGPVQHNTPIIYVLDQVPEAGLVKELVERFRVNQVMVHPIDPDLLLREVSRILKLAPPRGAALAEAVAALWQRYRPTVDQRLAVLEDVGRLVLEGPLPEIRREEAEMAAHQLAGKLGIYGFPRGSELALRLEGMLSEKGGEISARDYADVALSLRSVLEGKPNAEAPTGQLSRNVLVLDAPGQPLTIPVKDRDYELQRAQHPGQAQRLLSQSRPIAILVHLGVEQEHDQRLGFLREASQRHPDLPLVAFVSADSLFSRVEALRHGAQRIFEPDMSPQQLGALISSIISSQAKKVPRVLIVDDDPDLAEFIEFTLHHAGMITEHIASPATLLETLHRFSPDALLVDHELPVMSGLEICRLLRGIPRWQTLSLILVTGSAQRDMMIRALEAGADDFVAKPFQGNELVARINNRLERSRQLAELAATDPVTGLGTWVRGGPRIRGFMYLARRLSRPLSVVAVEIDAPDQGTAADVGGGDRLLARLAQLMQGQLRGEDTVCRYEGERLLLGLFGMRRGDCVGRMSSLASRFQQETGATFCSGITVFPQDAESLEGLVHAASRQLEEAQSRGAGSLVDGGAPGVQGGVPRTRVDVALVDDDALLGPLLVHALQKKGYSTLWLRDGLEAGRRLAGPQATESARLVLLEVDLPGQSGYNLVRQLKAADKLVDTRVLILSARSTQKDILTALELGATDHIPKPFTLPVLLEKVRRALQP
jgi:DNA-binding response OmpR family regulator